MTDSGLEQRLSHQVRQLDVQNRVIDDQYLAKDKSSLVSHSSEYDRLLKIYVDKVENTFAVKKSCIKPIIFVAAAILVIALLFFCYVIKKSIHMDINIEKLTIIIPVLISFLTVYIAIPKIIINYLFNDKEEEYMVKIIENIQNFDKEVRKNIREKEHQEYLENTRNERNLVNGQRVNDSN